MFIFPYIGFLVIPIDELIFFRGVAKKAPTSHETEVFSRPLGWSKGAEGSGRLWNRSHFLGFIEGYPKYIRYSKANSRKIQKRF